MEVIRHTAAKLHFWSIKTNFAFSCLKIGLKSQFLKRIFKNKKCVLPQCVMLAREKKGLGYGSMEEASLRSLKVP